MPVNEETSEEPNAGATYTETPLANNDNNESIADNGGEERQVEDSINETQVASEESSRLRELEADIRDQDDLERDIGRQVHSSHFA